MLKPSNFLKKLFDFSFSEFIALRIVSVLYMLAVGLTGLGAIAYILIALQEGIAAGLIAIILAPIVFLIYIILIRIGLESMIIVFRIAEHTSQIAEDTKYLRK